MQISILWPENHGWLQKSISEASADHLEPSTWTATPGEVNGAALNIPGKFYRLWRITRNPGDKLIEARCNVAKQKDTWTDLAVALGN